MPSFCPGRTPPLRRELPPDPIRTSSDSFLPPPASLLFSSCHSLRWLVSLKRCLGMCSFEIRRIRIQTDRQAGRQKDRQTDRQTDRYRCVYVRKVLNLSNHPNPDSLPNVFDKIAVNKYCKSQNILQPRFLQLPINHFKLLTLEKMFPALTSKPQNLCIW